MKRQIFHSLSKKKSSLDLLASIKQQKAERNEAMMIHKFFLKNESESKQNAVMEFYYY